MKSRSQRSGSADDPFSDGDEASISPCPQNHAAFDIDFSRPKHEHTPAKDTSATCEPKNSTLSPLRPRPLTSKSTLTCSSWPSSLAQHPNVMDFSSSPVGFSTPRIRLKPQLAKSTKRSVQTLQRSPSLLDFSFEGKSEDEHSLAPSATSKSVTDGSQSVKRKSAHSDLRSPALPAKKKSKIFPSSSNEEMAIGVSLMGIEDERVPLSSQDRNTVLAPGGRLASKSRGLKIFDVGKGKSVEAKCDGENRKVRPRPIINRRSSLPRSSSGLFSGRDSRPGLKRLTSFGADSMEIDELQINDATYQVGNNKRR